ncbi:uncharacterized protein [Melopsittacus undulatus]|uniref:uncharacterized protein n=1 Tax=Melopsittacus undulatus TaxID=13146 RepID=UPI00146E2283|nr:uncharacterized protein LOC117438389 [Melopsittacus undulatus]
MDRGGVRRVTLRGKSERGKPRKLKRSGVELGEAQEAEEDQSERGKPRRLKRSGAELGEAQEAEEDQSERGKPRRLKRSGAELGEAQEAEEDQSERRKPRRLKRSGAELGEAQEADEEERESVCPGCRLRARLQRRRSVGTPLRQGRGRRPSGASGAAGLLPSHSGGRGRAAAPAAVFRLRLLCRGAGGGFGTVVVPLARGRERGSRLPVVGTAAKGARQRLRAGGGGEGARPRSEVAIPEEARLEEVAVPGLQRAPGQVREDVGAGGVGGISRCLSPLTASSCFAPACGADRGGVRRVTLRGKSERGKPRKLKRSGVELGEAQEAEEDQSERGKPRRLKRSGAELGEAQEAEEDQSERGKPRRLKRSGAELGEAQEAEEDQSERRKPRRLKRSGAELGEAQEADEEERESVCPGCRLRARLQRRRSVGTPLRQGRGRRPSGASGAAGLLPSHSGGRGRAAAPAAVFRLRLLCRGAGGGFGTVVVPLARGRERGSRLPVVGTAAKGARQRLRAGGGGEGARPRSEVAIPEEARLEEVAVAGSATSSRAVFCGARLCF